MAEIGVMKKLTIGGKTYTIPEYSLPIASASTLGGVRVGTGLVIESGTGILSATGTDVTIDSEMSDSSTNPVQNQVIKAYIDQYKGTVTSVRVQATSPVQSSVSTAQSSSLNTTISLANGYGDTKNPYGTKTANYVLAGPSSGSAAAPSFRALVAADIPDLSGTYLTSYTETDPTVPSWAKASSKPTYTASEVGAASSTHTHGNITNGGDITATAPTIANGDQIIINDNSASKITNGPTFDGSTTTTALTPKGTWESFSKFSGSYNDLSNKPTIPTVPTAVSAFTNDAGYITSADVPEGASAYTGTISAVGTTASNGTNNGFARGDHVHNITSSTITTALGYTPYNSTNPNGYISSYTDEKLKWEQTTVQGTFYPLQGTSTETTSTANTINGVNFYQYYNTAGGYRRLNLGNSTAYKSTGGAYGTIRLYGAAATYYGDLVPGVLGTTSGDGHISANRTWTLPDKTGTIALTSDIPTTLPASDVSAWAKASSKPTYTATEVGALASDTTYVSTVTTTAGTHTAITSKSGTVSFNVPTKTSHLTNDSGFITSDSDENVKSTTVTAATTNYIVGSTSSSTATGGLSKHASALIYTTADSGTSGYTELRLGNTTATSSAGGKEGRIRLYGTNATYYITLQAGAVATSNKTITFPNATGTIALTSDIVDENVKITALTAASTYYLTGNNSFTTNTGGLNVHSSANLAISADSSTSGYTRLNLGNSTAGTTAGGREGTIRLYGSSTSYTDLKVGASTSAKTITFPDKTGTVALTSDIPTVPTKTSDLTNDSGFITSDTSVSITLVNPETSTTYYPTIYTSYSGTSVSLHANNYTRYWINQGTASQEGFNWLGLGNNVAKGTAGNQTGALRLYGAGGGYANLRYISAGTTNVDQYLPDTAGTILNSATTTYTQSLSSGTTIGTIKINGTSTTIYAPTNTDTKVTQNAATGDAWRKILGSSNYSLYAADGITSGANNTLYYDDDGPALNTSSGSIYAKNYLIELATTHALYTAIDSLGWTSAVIS